MIFRNVSFWIHRQLYLGLIAISCLMITAEFETTSGTFVRLYLKLYNFDEFLDYLNGKSTLDKAVLKRATTHLNDCSKHRRDYLQLNLREAHWKECATEDELTWPVKDEAKKAFMESHPFEQSFDSSRFKTTKIYNWVAGDFLMSAMQFPLSGVSPYSRMLFLHTHRQVDSKFIFINLHEGAGFQSFADYLPFFCRPTLKRKRQESDELIDRYNRLKLLLGDDKNVSINESCLESACQPPKPRVGRVVVGRLRSGLIKDCIKKSS